MNGKCFKMRSILSVCLVLLFPVCAHSQSPQSYSWSVAPPNVASVAWTNEQIGAFLDVVTASSVSSTVSDFAFEDFDADSQLELVAAVDFSGRRLFNTIVVVRQQGNNFAVQQIETLGVEGLHGMFADLNNDGRQELLVPTAITPYLGALTPQAKWTAIYGWDGPLLVDASSQFSAYYVSTILPSLLQTLNNLQATSPGAIQADIAQVEYDKTLRISGQDPVAGLVLAQSWATSGDSTHRILAAAVLADVGTTTAVTALNALANDSDPNVVVYGRSAVQSIADLHFTSAQIDIKPGSTSSPINLSSRGKIPVAILSSSTLDAPASVNVQTLTFGSTGSEHSLVFCDPNGEDVNGDGLLDLVCHFDSQASFFQLGDAAGTLKGRLKDGTAIRGVAPVIIVNQ